MMLPWLDEMTVYRTHMGHFPPRVINVGLSVNYTFDFSMPVSAIADAIFILLKFKLKDALSRVPMNTLCDYLRTREIAPLMAYLLADVSKLQEAGLPIDRVKVVVLDTLTGEPLDDKLLKFERRDARVIKTQDEREQSRRINRANYVAKPETKKLLEERMADPEVQKKRKEYAEQPEVKERKKRLSERTRYVVKKIKIDHPVLYKQVLEQVEAENPHLAKLKEDKKARALERKRKREEEKAKMTSELEQEEVEQAADASAVVSETTQSGKSKRKAKRRSRKLAKASESGEEPPKKKARFESVEMNVEK